ncbi:MAG: hypothetical protein HY711_10715 [Candidatus Melainabacteria bacterium]|nr:hypothetical protein [Candidatus Melainabacteria bacterium]
MRVLVVGAGAREHALIWKLKQSSNVQDVICAPGNLGIAQLTTCAPVQSFELEKLADLAIVQRIDLTVASDPVSIRQGIVNYFRERRLRIFGPSQEVSHLISNRYFAKELMLKARIPTARYAAFELEELAHVYADSQKLPIVIKPAWPTDGWLTSIAQSYGQAHQAIKQLFATGCEPNKTIIIEDYLSGWQVSLEVISDGLGAVMMLPVHIARHLHDGNTGPITPGMGAYAPLTLTDNTVLSQLLTRIVDPLLRSFSDTGTPYCGALHLNISIAEDDSPRVLSLGTTLSALATQVLLPLLEEDLLEIFWAVTEGNLAHYLSEGFHFNPLSCLAVVFSCQDYRAQDSLDSQIQDLSQLETAICIEKQVLHEARPVTIMARPLVFHQDFNNSQPVSPNQALLTLNEHIARTFTLAVVAETLLDAKVAAYELAQKLGLHNVHYRKDLADLGPN